MSKFTYNGNNSSIRVAGFLFVKGVETELSDEQTELLKADGFGKAFLEDGSFVETEQADKEPDAKPVSKMKVEELEAYIIENGGEFAESDNKPELLVIAQAIEEAKNAKD
ncbi:hypothetical protein Q6344_09155 [Psychrobacter cibarius]|nr:hypothetical protein Q6344_09155 [Psychrobacter cibarius]